MEQQLVIVRIEETVARDKVSRKRNRQIIPLSQLKPGAEIAVSDHRKIQIVDLNDEELRFTLNDTKSYVLNRYWQVLGTVKFDLQSGWYDENERFTFHFETPVEKAEDGVHKRIEELAEAMKEQREKGKYWKNIPKAREIMHLFKDCCPVRDEEINPAVRIMGVEFMASDRMLPPNDAPRLFLSLYEYWEICHDLWEEKDGKVDTSEDNTDWLNRKIFKFTWTVDPCMTSDLYNKMFGDDIITHFDFVQLSPEWEKNVYDIEKEAEEVVGEDYLFDGFCFDIWSAIRNSAAKRGITWRSPNIMNPGVIWD